jgi:O-antigen/teichoic acid export membrane protein
MTIRSSKAIRGMLWMLSGTGSGQILSFIITVILARILSPEDFAAVALIMAVLAIVNTFAEMGLSVAVVQRKTITPTLLDSALMLTLSFFLVISIAIFFFSESFAQYYQLPLLAPLTQIAAVAFFFQGLNSFYRSMLLRETRFKAVSLVAISSVSINGAIAITQALLGYGAYSILWGQLGANIGAFIILITITRFIPQGFGSVKLMRELLGFGAWVSIGRILGTAAGQFDRFLIGKILPEKVLGGYHIASRLTMAIPGLLTGMIDQVLLPIYSNSKNDAAVIERGYWKGLRYSAILIVPMALVIAIYSRPIVFLILGEKWLYITPIIQIISIFSIFQGLGGGIFASAIYASGIPKLTSIVNLFRIIALPSCVWFGSQWGVLGVAWGVAVFGIAGRFFNQWLLKIYLSYSLGKFFQVIARPIAANAGLLVFGMICQSFITLRHPVDTALTTSLCGLLTFGIYGAMCRVLMPEDSRFLFEQFRQITRFASRG